MTDAFDDGPTIQTPDRRLRVFVSSTLAELADERVAVARAINALHLTPVMFELGARPHPPQELYRAYLAQSDIFIGLYWQRYGWVGPGMDISGLEDEFQLSGGLPRLLYLKTPSPDREPRLTLMIAELEAQGVDAYRRFSSTRELGRLVRDDLALLLSERFTMSARPHRPLPAPVATSPRSLPVMSTSLIGRDEDIRAVTDLLLTPDVRLVTLSGPGGIGKTRLAVAVGDALAAQTSQRVVFVALAAISQPELVLPQVAAIAGATIEGNRLPLDALTEHFAAVPTLLILDNLEQVVAVAADLDRLLSSCPGLKVLTTSRTVLRLRAEHEYAVAPLAVGTADIAASSSAVQLFVDRASAVRRGFVLTQDNAAAIVEICRRLDGLPLAIELAAARTRLLDPAGLLARLERVLDGLGTGPVDLPERQRTLRATVEWSIDLLADAERELLFTLSVFVDGWTVAAAARVSAATEDDTLDLLDALAGHSLVSVDAEQPVPRFHMLTSVRELAAERLAATDRDVDVEARHARYFAELVEAGEWPAERQSEWVDRLRNEEQNLRRAIRWFFGHDITPLPTMFRALWLFWQLSDRMPEGRAWVDELRVRPEPLDDHARAEVLFTWAVTSVEVGDDVAAGAAVAEIERLGPVDDPYLVSALQLAIAWARPIDDDFEGALTAASTALVGFRQQNQPFVAFAALTVGMVQMTLGHEDIARQHLLEVKDLGDRYGNTWLTSSARTQLAMLAVRSGQLDEAKALLLEAVDAIEGGAHISTLSVTFALVASADLALAEGSAARAATALGAVAGLRERAGLLAWPVTRRIEADLGAHLAATADPAVVAECHAAGVELHHREALRLVRDGVGGPTR